MDLKFDFDDQIEQLAKIPRLARTGIVVAILVATGAGYYFLSYQDRHGEMTALRGQAQELQRQLNKVRAVATNVDEFEQEVASLERQLQEALTQLPDRKQFEDLLQDITTAGKKVGVTIKSIERTSEIEHDFYAEVPFSIALEGSYHNLAMFFERIAKLPRIVNIGSMRIEVGTTDGIDPILGIMGTATTFRFLSDLERV